MLVLLHTISEAGTRLSGFETGVVVMPRKGSSDTEERPRGALNTSCYSCSNNMSFFLPRAVW